MNYGYNSGGFGQQGFGGGQQPAMMPGTGFGAAMPRPNFYNTSADVEAQRQRLKLLGLDETMLDDALKLKQGLFEKRDEMKSDLKDSMMDSISGALKGSSAAGAAGGGGGLAGMASSL